MLKELIRAIYEIAKAIKGNNGESGGGETSNDNGLYGADGIIVTEGDEQEESKVFLSQKELFDDFKANVLQYVNGGVGRNICFLYTENNIDKLLKPTSGVIGMTDDAPSEQFQFSANFLNEDNLETFELLSIQDHFSESDVQKVAEKLGNNVYFLMKNLTPGGNPFEPIG